MADPLLSTQYERIGSWDVSLAIPETARAILLNEFIRIDTGGISHSETYYSTPGFFLFPWWYQRMNNLFASVHSKLDELIDEFGLRDFEQIRQRFKDDTIPPEEVFDLTAKLAVISEREIVKRYGGGNSSAWILQFCRSAHQGISQPVVGGTPRWIAPDPFYAYPLEGFPVDRYSAVQQSYPAYVVRGPVILWLREPRNFFTFEYYERREGRSPPQPTIGANIIVNIDTKLAKIELT
ncbi:hypothetical protein HYU19_05320 [Candidatus Woesearchaeota archaeon]|nr:hypothetical protein [Candidatus Woesearchaeota archaeon]